MKLLPMERDVAVPRVKGTKMCEHVVSDMHAGENVSVIAHRQDMEDGVPVYVCHACLVTLRVQMMGKDIDAQIASSTEDPKLAILVAGSFAYSYTGSKFGNPDLLYIEECVGGDMSNAIFNEVLHDHMDFLGEVNIINSKVAISPKDGKAVRVLLRKIEVPRHHELNYINCHGDLSKLKLIQMFVSDLRNKLPGEFGYYPVNPSSDKTAVEYFSPYLDA